MMAADDPFLNIPWRLVLPALAALGAIALACAVALLFVLMRPRRSRPAGETDDLSVELSALKVESLPETGPRLEYYGTPVRLAVLVLAPAGRGVSLPPKDELRELVDHLIPGLANVVDLHRPIFRRWPQQLSSQGFAQSFFSNIPLPGERGKGTPWCCAAGKFESGSRQFLVGLICRAEAPNSLSQVVVQHHGQWHDVLRVKTE